MADVCRSCGAPILWGISARSGKSVPLDPEPVENGNLRLTGPPDFPTVIFVREGTHVSHFATCPNAAAHRKR